MAVQDKRRDAEKTPAAAPRAQSDAPAPVGLVSRQVSTEQRADNTYREAVALVRQGRTTEAQGLLRQALADMPAHHEARLLHARLLAGDGRSAEARSLLGEGLGLKSPPLAMYTTLAQAQLLARDAESAVTTLERGLPQAGENAEYHALLAAALQQQDRHADAVQHYLVALRQFPDAANWLVGLGVSLQATRNPQGAAEAYQHGIELGLPSALTQFARERLEQLKR